MVQKKTSAKLHVFEPSGRRVWTVVGPGAEHWVDPDMRVCSCKAFHFGRGECAHILAALNGKSETVRFSDDEFEGFVDGLLADIWVRSSVK